MGGQRAPRPEHVTALGLGDLIALLRGEAEVIAPQEGTSTVSVSGVELDSRRVRPGDLYAALPGRATHGARFAEQAVGEGAVAIITDREGERLLPRVEVPVLVVDEPRARLGEVAAAVYGNPGERMRVLGVTGTNGKTTVATMVAAGLRAAGRTVGVIGTVGTRIGEESFEGVRTTPEAPELQGLLALMLERGVDAVVMEVSSIAVVEHRIDGLVLDVIGFTNLTQDHLDYHGTMDEYFAAKAALFDPARARAGVVGIDDEWGSRLLERARGAGLPLQTWALADPHADWHAQRDAGSLRVVDPRGHRTEFSLRLPGAFNVANAVCAFAMLDAVGVRPEQAAPGIAEAVVPGRMQAFAAGGVTGVVDYAHTPDAVERVLRTARSAYPGQVIAVLGAGGDRDRAKRPLMGACAAAEADHVIVTDDNPRSEDPRAIRADVLAGVASVAPARRASVEEVGDRLEAITVAVRRAHAGDVVLVLGKGHERGQEAGGVVAPFDDAAALRAALIAAHGDVSP